MTRRILPLAGLLVLAVWLAATPDDVRGCAPAPRNGESAEVAEETALIVWDEATRTQHFVRRATFVGNAYDFGFLVPTPNPPRVEAADPELFAELARITEPKTEHRTVNDWSFGCFSMSASKTAEQTAEPAPSSGLVVLEQKRVGSLDYAILAFRGDKGLKPDEAADSLLSWLDRHQYAVRPDLKQWLKPYIENFWTITAFKIAPSKDTAKGGENSNSITVKSAAVRMSFKADRPFFPYREPADQRELGAKNVPRLLRVYVAAKQRMAGKLGDGTAIVWPGRTVWANAITEAERTSLLDRSGKLPHDIMPGKWWITEFEDRSSPRPGFDEVYFETSVDSSMVVRPPNMLTTYKTPGWFAPVVFGVPLVLIVGGVLAWRWARGSRWRNVCRISCPRCHRKSTAARSAND